MDLAIQLGDLLVQRGLATEEQVRRARELQKRTGVRIGEALLSLGVVSAEALADLLSEQLGLERATGFWEEPPVPDLPENLVRKHKIFPRRKETGKLYVATADPLDIAAADEVRFATGLEIVPEVASPEEVERALRRWYGPAVPDGEMLKETEEPEVQEETDGPAVRLVGSLLEGALADGASDVHIEPTSGSTVVRYRLDGRLRDVMELPRGIHGAVISRIKVMAGMDIAERRLPQDGRFRLTRPRPVDVRVSTLPTVFGEKAVLRILDKTRIVPRLEVLGYGVEALARLRAAVRASHGMVLLTGPTGSGKTTTLYAALSEVVTREVNVVTVEDPPEYELPGVNQVPVNLKAGLDFASALRAILRQDPDIIMVGEIRDAETARIAVRAAMTGHLVLSTLHTNDAASALVRLMDMGIEPYLVASTVLCVAAQRLVRLVCSRCAYEYAVEPDPAVQELFGNDVPPRLKRGKGCRWCRGSGYRGRTAAVEVLNVTRGIRDLIRAVAGVDQIRELAVAEGMVPLKEDVKAKVLAGLTTPEEALRVVAVAEG